MFVESISRLSPKGERRILNQNVPEGRTRVSSPHRLIPHAGWLCACGRHKPQSRGAAAVVDFLNVGAAVSVAIGKLRMSVECDSTNGTTRI